MLARVFIVLILAPLSAHAQLFPDSVGSPLPEKRTALLTAFSDGIPAPNPSPSCGTVFCSRMNELQAKFEGVGYAVTPMLASRPNEADPPASHPGYFTVQDFEAQLAGRKYGVVVTNGHAGNIGIAVEHFLTQAQMEARLVDLVPASYPASEVQSFAPTDDPTERVIAVSRNFVANRARLAKNAIVWNFGCNTFRWFNRNQTSPNDVANADIVWLDPEPGVGAVFYVGVAAGCPFPFNDPTNQLNFFGQMLGQTPINNAKRNFTVREAFDARTNAFLLSRARNNDSSVNKLRLYNAPRRPKTKIEQSPVYDYSYTDQIYPFTDGDYPGDLTSAAVGFGHSGPMTITLQFSEPMDPSWSGFKVQLDPQGPGAGAAAIDFTGSWSTTIFPNDTWTGNLTVPTDGTGIDGEATVVVKARDAFQGDDSSSNADGELDTDGDGLADGVDTSVRFTIDPTHSFVVV